MKTTENQSENGQLTVSLPPTTPPSARRALLTLKQLHSGAHWLSNLHLDVDGGVWVLLEGLNDLHLSRSVELALKLSIPGPQGGGARGK